MVIYSYAKELLMVPLFMYAHASGDPLVIVPVSYYFINDREISELGHGGVLVRQEQRIEI